MKALEDLYQKMVCELEELAKGELSMSKIETIDKLAHASKNLKKVIYEEESSQGGRWNAQGMSYDNGMSNRGGMHYVRGHYSHDDGMSYMSDRMSQAMGDSRYRDEREMMQRHQAYR